MTTAATPRALEALRTNVIVARARARISQAELAERSGLSRATISKIENGDGDVTIGTIEQVAATLGCTIMALLDAGDERGIEADDDELVRRASAPDDEFIDVRALLGAVEEAAGRDPERYSRAGRPRVAR